MLNLQYQHPGKFRTDPLLILVISLFLLNPVVPGEMKSLRIVWLQIGIWGGRPKIIKTRDKMVMEDHQRKPRFRVRIEALWDQHNPI